MVLKIVFYVFLYHCGKLFNCERGHINKTSVARILDLGTLKDLALLWERRLSIFPSSLSSLNQPRPQIMATEVVRLPPMLKVRNLFTFSI